MDARRTRETGPGGRVAVGDAEDAFAAAHEIAHRTLVQLRRALERRGVQLHEVAREGHGAGHVGGLGDPRLLHAAEIFRVQLALHVRGDEVQLARIAQRGERAVLVDAAHVEHVDVPRDVVVRVRREQRERGPIRAPVVTEPVGAHGAEDELPFGAARGPITHQRRVAVAHVFELARPAIRREGGDGEHHVALRVEASHGGLDGVAGDAQEGRLGGGHQGIIGATRERCSARVHGAFFSARPQELRRHAHGALDCASHSGRVASRAGWLAPCAPRALRAWIVQPWAPCRSEICRGS